jgi:hypothetical protein
VPNHDHVRGTGHATKQEGLDVALERAWEDAKDNHRGQPGPYVVERIEIECRNPIHSYTVIIVSQ